MRVILVRLLNEPAAAIGFAGAVATYIVTDDILLALAYLGSALGVRQVVTPTHRKNAVKDEGNPT